MNNHTSQTMKFTKDGKWFKDEYNRYVLFRGVNIGPRTKLPAYLPTIPLDATDINYITEKKFELFLKDVKVNFDQLKDLGFNVVRLLVMWKGIEPYPVSDPQIISTEGQQYLELITKVIDELHSRGIFVIIDFHQDVAHEAFDGDGFPDWTVNPDRLPDIIPKPNNRFWQLGYVFNLGVKETLNRFWNKSKIKFRGEYLIPQEHLSKTIGAAARFFQSLNDGNGHPGIIGYELFNEPTPINQLYSRFENNNLLPYYKKTIREIRKTIGDKKGDTSSFIFMEPRVDILTYADAELGLGFLGKLLRFNWRLNISSIQDDKLVYSFHYYDVLLFALPFILSVNFKKRRYRDILAKLKSRAIENGGIPFLSEFGASNDWKSSPWLDPDNLGTVNRASIASLYQAVEQNLLNSTYWDFELFVTVENNGNWNRENFSILDANRNLRNTDLISRPYPRYSSVKPISLEFDVNTKQCVMRFTGFAVDEPTVIFIPKIFQYSNGFQVLASSGVATWDDTNQLLTWRGDKADHEHMMVIILPGNFNKSVIPKDCNGMANKLDEVFRID